MKAVTNNVSENSRIPNVVIVTANIEIKNVTESTNKSI